VRFTYVVVLITCVCDISMLQVSIDLLSWDFSVMTVDDSNISASPKVRRYFLIVVAISQLYAASGLSSFRLCLGS